jgi:hypothetical protein
MRRLSVLVLCCLIIGAFGGPVAAHDDHPGRYIPSPESSSKNLKLIASSEKTVDDPTYRNSDLAFWGRLAYAGNYLGFRILDISEPEAPVVIADVDCPGAQHDISVWKHLMFLSIDAPRTGPECDSRATGGAPGFEGIRVFDVSDPANPRYVTGVATDCGSHTHTLVPDERNGRVLIYVSSYPASSFGPTPYGTDCKRRTADGGELGHSKIAIVEVPMANPAAARVAAEPVFELNNRPNAPGYRGCHDITVFLELQRAAAACMSEGQIWDISDPLAPRTIARIHNPAVEFFHSAAFTWDGQVVVFGDEAGGGTGPRCRDRDPATLGAVWFYRVADLDVLDGTTREAPLGSYKVPRNQGDAANCTMHNFNVIPVEGRYILVSSAYAAGTTVADFTDPANAREIAHHDPHGANTWSSYWYNGFIYTNDGGRGVDVMLLSDKARAGARRWPHHNPQTQESLLRRP